MDKLDAYAAEHFGQADEPGRYFSNPLTIKRGVIFTHTHWLDSSTNAPLRCLVTAVRNGTVYYRPHYGLHDDGTPWLGSCAYFALADARQYVSEMSFHERAR